MQKDYHCPLLPGHIYHLINRAVGNEKLFRTSDNYVYVLAKYAQHTKPICDTYCYCLLPDHFHLLVKMKDKQDIASCFETVKRKKLLPNSDAAISDFLMERFSNWLNAYAKAYDKVYDRKGALFLDYTKRLLIEQHDCFAGVIHYIHANAVHHRLVTAVSAWQHSSYNSLLSAAPTLLLRDKVMALFGNKNEFIRFHQQPFDRGLAQLLE